MMATISPPGSPVLPQQGELDSLSSLVPAAAAGDRDAWERLVARYSSMVGNVARGYRLNAVDIDGSGRPGADAGSNGRGGRLDRSAAGRGRPSGAGRPGRVVTGAAAVARAVARRC